MRSVSVSMVAATSARITQPGYLIEILSTPALRVSTRETVSALGQSWVAADVKVTGLGGSNAAPRLQFEDADGLIAAMLLQGTLNDAPVRIWACDAAAMADADVVLVFSGAVAAQSIDPGRGVSLTVAAGRAGALFSPRLFYGPQLGMTRMVPIGTLLKIGANQYKVDRR